MGDYGSLRQNKPARHKAPLDIAQYPEIALLRRAGSDHNRQINLIVQPIVIAIGQIEIDVNMQMAAQEMIENGNHALAAERDGACSLTCPVGC